MNLRTKEYNRIRTRHLFDIPEIVAKEINEATGETVSESAIILVATAVLIYRYTGFAKIKLNVKTADRDAEIEIDAADVASTANHLFIQSHFKLKELLGLPAGLGDMTIELPGDVMRPVMRSISEATDSEAAIQLQCENQANKAVCKFIYSPKYYPDELIHQMARHFKNILADIAARHDVRIKDIDMLSAEERAEILKHGVGAIVETGKKCAHQLFEEQAAKNPQATALICGQQTMSYNELNDRANVIGHYLQSRGVGVGTVVGVGMERSIEAIVCILAIFKAGAAYTIVNPEYPAARIKEMLMDAGISLLITKSSLKANFGYEGVGIIDYEQFSDYRNGNTTNVVSSVTVNDAAYISFTSGSTGKPKGIVGMHLSIATLLYYSMFFYKESAVNEVSGLLSPLSFGASICGTFMPLCNGAPLVLIPDGEEKDPYKFACRINEHKITSFIMTTALARQLCGLTEEGKKLLKSVKHVGIGGDEVTPDLLRAVKQIMPGITITVGYSCSEIGLAAFDRLVEETDLKENERIPMGHPGPNSKTYILDRDMNLVPDGVPGELYVSAPYLSREYIGRPELTARRFLANPFTDETGFKRMYRTGDMVRRRMDCEIEYISRADSEVKIRGYRIETEEIETILRTHMEVDEAVVTVDKGKFTERLIAWVVRKLEAETDIPELRQYIKKSLPGYMVPSVFIFMNRLPLNANGKIDRETLSFDSEERAAETRDYKGPRNQLESIIADIWQKMLDMEKVGIHDDFLDIGGDSIQAGLISLEIRDRFNVEIPIIMFIEGMTIATLAEEIYHVQENEADV